MAAPSLIFFEAAPTVLDVCLLWRQLRRARQVWVQFPGYTPQAVLGGQITWRGLLRRLGRRQRSSPHERAVRLLRRVNPSLEIREIALEDVLPMIYRLNQACLPEVDRWVERQAHHPMMTFMSRLVGEPGARRYYQSYAARVVPIWRLFLRQAADLHQRAGPITVVPSSPLGDIWREPDAEPIARAVTRSIDWLNRLRCIGTIFATRAALALAPLAYCVLHVRNGFGRPAIPRHDVVMSVQWGVFEDGNRELKGIKRFHDDLYLYGERLQPGRILHLFGDWRFPAAVEDRFRRAMQQRGLLFADRRRFRLTAGFLREALRVQALALRAALGRRCTSRGDLVLASGALKGVYYHLRAELEMENLEYRVAYVRNDYNPGHVVHTMAARRRGRRVVGAAHDGTAHILPQIAYATFDRYLSVSEIFARTFSPYWDSVNLARTGRESVDWLFAKLGSAEATRQRIENLYGRRRYVVTVMFPSPLGHKSAGRQWREIQDGLRQLHAVDLDAHIFLRFRQAAHLEHRHVVPIRQVAANDPRMIIDHENFTTPELQSASDVVITPHFSFAITEALLARKPVFTFAYLLLEDLCFPAERYGRDFVLMRGDDLPRVLSRLPERFAGLDVRWDVLLQDADYHRDGRNCDRIRQVVLDMCDEAAAAPPAYAQAG